MKQNKYKAIPVNPNNMGKNRVKWTDRIFFDILINGSNNYYITVNYIFVMK